MRATDTTAVMPQERDLKRKPSWRLRSINTHEVGMVDRPANLRPFLVKKDASMPPKQRDDEQDADKKSESAKPEPAGIGVMTPVTKAAVLACTAEVIEQIEAVALAVGNAEVDEKADTPETIAKMLAAAGDRLHAEAAKYAPDYAEKAKVAKAEAEAEEAARLEKSAYEGWLSKWEETAKAVDTINERVEALTKSVAEVAKLSAPLDRVYHQLRTAISKSALVAPADPVGNGKPTDEASPPPNDNPSAPAPRVIWPADLARG